MDWLEKRLYGQRESDLEAYRSIDLVQQHAIQLTPPDYSDTPRKFEVKAKLEEELRSNYFQRVH